MKISGVYKILNTVTGDFYIGSSRNVKRRWLQHKYQSVWKLYPNNPLYQDMQKYGVDKFEFQILVPVMPEYLTKVEQEFIEMLNPTYNNNNAKGLNLDRYKESQKKYQQSDRYKEAQKEYHQSEKYKEYQKKYQKEYHKKYQQSEKYKETHKKYQNQFCSYNGETLTLDALSVRFYRAGIPHPNVEARKYLITTQ